MGLHQRVSDPEWTMDERVEVIRTFLDQADMALQGPLCDEENFSDPNSGVGGFKLLLETNRETGEQRASIEYEVLDKDGYVRYITWLRPFILSEQDVFLPKVTRHVQVLLKDEYKTAGDNLTAWIDGFVSFDEPHYAPVHSYVYVAEQDGSNEVGASSADLAMDYIYGHVAKLDIEKRRRIKPFEDKSMNSIGMALNEYLQQLLKLVYVMRQEIRNWDERDMFVCKLL